MIDYWKTAVDALSETIEEIQSRAGCGAFRFLWLSDLHGVNGYKNTNGAGTSVTKNIGHVVKYAIDKFNIPFVAISGDIMSQASYADEASVWNEYKDIYELLSPIDKERLFYTKGNHDGAWGAPVDGVYYLNNIGGNKLYDALFRRQALDRGRVFGGDGSYFYVDSPQKVRFIMLNSQTDGDGSTDDNGHAVYNSMKNSVYGTEQLNWLANEALDLPENWSAVLMTHQPLNTSKDGNVLADILEAYNSRRVYSNSVDVSGRYWGNRVTDTLYTQVSCNVDFTDAKGEVIAFFHGHIHRDTINTSCYSFPMISITTAGGDVRDAEPVERVSGTSTETAIDIVTIDGGNRMIYMSRLGVGFDREIGY